MSKAREAVEQFKRELLEKRLLMVSEEQRALFDRIYPKGVPVADLLSAIDLVDRTIAGNEQRALDKKEGRGFLPAPEVPPID